MQKISFTPKETDIYKIHQSGDLANLDGLEEESLKQLPAMLELRNAMYSQEFRAYLSGITDSGPLSGQKTDMAMNIYTPGSHLLCHDDVIGSRRVSYILYLTDPDNPWQADWGGALRLYPTRSVKQVKGPKLKVPDPEHSLSIPPAWNQLSYFAVQPGESFHDVEEVYSSGDAKIDQERVRLAISGWYHIPQEGEEGYEKGMEENLKTSSSLTQLQSKDELDLPRPQAIPYSEYETASTGKRRQEQDPEADELTTSECDFLLQFMAPRFLTPDTVQELKAKFQDASCIRVDDFLSPKFADTLRKSIANEPSTYDVPTEDVEGSSAWTVARPPHKHRYLFMLPSAVETEGKPDLLAKDTMQTSPIKQLLNSYLPSGEFRKWLLLSTGLVLRSHDLKVRRFRHGKDYQLATSYDEENPRLEMTLGISPEGKWETEEQDTKAASEPTASTSKDPEDLAKTQPSAGEEVNNGGYEVWTAGDDDSTQETMTTTATTTTASSSDPSGPNSTDAGASESKPGAAADPAIYQSNPSGAPDDGILFSMPAGWNRLSLVLRDSGTLRFVKYVSRNAGADRWDVAGDWEVDWDATPEFEDVEEIGEEELAAELEEEFGEAETEQEEESEESEEEEEEWGGLSSEDEEEKENAGNKAGSAKKGMASPGRFTRRRK